MASEQLTYNSNTVVVNVGDFVKFFLEFGMFSTRPMAQSMSIEVPHQTAHGLNHLLDTTRVQGRLVDRIGDHFQ